jgi:hypothetical protein
MAEAIGVRCYYRNHRDSVRARSKELQEKQNAMAMESGGRTSRLLAGGRAADCGRRHDPATAGVGWVWICSGGIGTVISAAAVASRQFLDSAKQVWFDAIVGVACGYYSSSPEER